MKPNFVFSFVLIVALAAIPAASLPASAQAGGQAAAPAPPIPYATANQVNGLMSQLESTATSTASDLSRLRINKWKAPGGAKKQDEENRQSILRNLESALPGMIGAVRSNPDDIAASFTLYRNLDALYDVLGSVAQDAGAFGPREDYEPLANDMNSVEQLRRQLAERIATLASSKETELARLRTEVQAARAAAAAAPPKKVIVDDNAPEKKPARKKRVVHHPVKKKPETANKPAAKPESQPQ
ncbi:MAG TPA: hypothetical protein VFU27_08515 [Terriglobales bacterium]|nr:hypothetical protein [Terriglobales bacterium]